MVCCANATIFFKVKGEKFIVIAAATDNFTIITNWRRLSTKTKAQLNDHFELVDLEDINWLLGVSITRDFTNHTISLGQSSYVELILTRFGLTDARPEHTPMEAGADFHLNSPSVSPTCLSAVEKTTYCEIIGSLMYCTTMTRPDIMYAVSMLSQFL